MTTEPKPTTLDAFGRLRVSDPVTVFASTMQYDLGPLFWQTITNGSGSACAHDANFSCANLTVTTTSGGYVIRQTYRYWRYQPGKSHFPILTGVLGAASANRVKRIGYFDDANGLFFEVSSAGIGIVKRVRGTDTRVDAAQWNGKDSSFASEIEPSAALIFWFDVEYLGVGTVRAGIVHDGQFLVLHEFHHDNRVTRPYMATATLPQRYEIRNTGVATGTDTVVQICSTVISEGGYDDNTGPVFSVHRATSAASVAARKNVIAIRPAATFNGFTNRGTIVPVSIGLYVTGQAILWEAVWKGAVASPSYATAGENTATEFSTAVQDVTGGYVVGSDYLAASASTRSNITASLADRVALSLDYAGTAADEFALVCTPLTGTATVLASITFRVLL